MEFKELVKKVQEQFNKMQENKLFRSEVTGDTLWEIYLSSFKEEDNPIFRVNTVNDGNNDKNFFRRYGNIVTIDKNNNIVTMFDIELDKSCEYYGSVIAVRNTLKNSGVKDVFFETFDSLNSLPYEKCTKKQQVYKLGLSDNHVIYKTEEEAKGLEVGKVYQYNHYHTFLKADFVDKTGVSVESKIAEYRDSKNVFKRGLDEISLDTLLLVKDLITQGSLLNGDSYLDKLVKFIEYKKSYDKVSSNKDNWAWLNSYDMPYPKFRNELIGVLCTELSEGKGINECCKDWNKRVDPVNYMKVKAPITQKQINEAKKFVEENGYSEAFNRRFATIDDINVEEILHTNKETVVKTASVFDNVKPTVSTKHKRAELKDVEEVSIEKFMKDILPNVTGVEAFLEARHENNLVAMTTAQDKSCKLPFKWNNPFSWTYKGNLAGKSFIKDKVKEKGGNVEGVLRFSLIWNESGVDTSDLDAWCIQPDGSKIGYSEGYRKDGSGRFSKYGGQLDLDNTDPGKKVGVENIYFNDMKKLTDGEYMFYVNQFSSRNSKGFRAEIEFEGQSHTYEYNSPVIGSVFVATIIVKKGEISIQHKLPSDSVSKEMWGLESDKFHKVNLVCTSPNHWADNNVGNKHYFFMLDKCTTDSSMRGFHNENLNSDLLKHRKVMDILGETTKIEPTQPQLAGLGFNATVSDGLVVRLKGTFKRTVKIKF